MASEEFGLLWLSECPDFDKNAMKLNSLHFCPKRDISIGYLKLTHFPGFIWSELSDKSEKGGKGP